MNVMIVLWQKIKCQEYHPRTPHQIHLNCCIYNFHSHFLAATFDFTYLHWPFGDAHFFTAWVFCIVL